MKLFGKNVRNPKRFIVIMIVLLLLASLAVYYTNSYLNSMIESSMLEIAKLGAKTIEHKIDWTVEKLVLMSRLATIQSDTTSIDRKLEVLRAIDKYDAGYDYAYINKDGDLYSVSGKSYSVKEFGFFIEAMQGKQSMETIDNNHFVNYPVIAFAVPVNNGSEINGAVSILYSAEVLCELVENITFSEGGYGYIIDSKGLTIAHTNRDYVIERMNSIYDAAHDSELSKLANLERKMILRETGSGQYIFHGKKKLMGYAPIEHTTWAFAATTPVDDSFNNIEPLITLMASVLGLFILSFLLVNYYFAALNKKIEKEEKSLKAAVDTGKIIMISFLQDGIIIDFNINAEELLRFNKAEIVKTMRIFDLLAPQEEEGLLRSMSNALKHGRTDNFEISFMTSAGTIEHILFSMIVQNKSSDIHEYELMGVCINDRVKNYEGRLIEKHEELSAVYEQLAASEEELKSQLDELLEQKKLLQEKDQRYNLVVQASNLGIWDWDASTDTYFYSDKWYEIFETEESSIESFAGRKKGFEYNLIIDEDRNKVKEAHFNHLEKATDSYECEYRVRMPDGRIKWIHTVGKASFDKSGRPIRMAGSNADITTKKEAEERIQKLAYYDSLTGLSNRSRFSLSFNELIESGVEDIAIAIVDIYNFKLINDSYGHDIGDRLLIEVANRLRDKQTDKMELCRIGADDYAILLFNYDNEDNLVKSVIEIIDYMDTTIKLDSYDINLTVNAGLAIYNKDGNTLDALLKNADTAKYRAYEQKIKFVSFDSRMNDIIVEKLNIMNSLKYALANDEFVLFYQPQYNSETKKIMGFESLVRWKSETMGIVSPGKFIPIAEESGDIIPLGEWILEESIRFIKRIHQIGYEELIISVNISVIQFIQDGFAERVLALLDKYDLPPDRLELEITESMMMEGMDAVKHNLDSIENAGIAIALDDFGTGYSSLNYLTKIPIKTLKIDKSFVDTIGHFSETNILLDKIIDIGHGLGLSVVAEGVESEYQYVYLERMKCQRIQGYYFSKPVPESNIYELLKKENHEENL